MQDVEMSDVGSPDITSQALVPDGRMLRTPVDARSPLPQSSNAASPVITLNLHSSPLPPSSDPATPVATRNQHRSSPLPPFSDTGSTPTPRRPAARPLFRLRPMTQNELDDGFNLRTSRRGNLDNILALQKSKKNSFTPKLNVLYNAKIGPPPQLPSVGSWGTPSDPFKSFFVADKPSRNDMSMLVQDPDTRQWKPLAPGFASEEPARHPFSPLVMQQYNFRIEFHPHEITHFDGYLVATPANTDEDEYNQRVEIFDKVAEIWRHIPFGYIAPMPQDFFEAAEQFAKENSPAIAVSNEDEEINDLSSSSGSSFGESSRQARKQVQFSNTHKETPTEDTDDEDLALEAEYEQSAVPDGQATPQPKKVVTSAQRRADKRRNTHDVGAMDLEGDDEDFVPEAEHEESAVLDGQSTPRPRKVVTSARHRADTRGNTCDVETMELDDAALDGDDEDENADVNNDQPGKPEHKKGRYSKEELAKLEKWGQRVLDEGRVLSVEMDRSLEQILQRGLREISFGRKENPWAFYKHWYSIMEKATYELGTFIILFLVT